MGRQAAPAYEEVARALLEYGIDGHFPKESIVVVEALLSKLRDVSDACEEYRERFEEAKNDAAAFKEKVDPVKKENSRLLKEQSRMFQENLASVERAEKAELKLQEIKRHFENKLRDRDFVIEFQKGRMEELEASGTSLAEKLDETLAKFANSSTVNSKISLGKHASHMKISDPVIAQGNESKATAASSKVQAERQKSIDLLQMRDEQIEQLTTTCDRLRADLLQSRRYEEELRGALERRKQEVERLLSLIPAAGPNSDSIDLQEANIRNQQLVAQLKEQLDFASTQSVEAEKDKENIRVRLEDNILSLHNALRASEEEKESLLSTVGRLEIQLEEALARIRSGQAEASDAHSKEQSSADLAAFNIREKELRAQLDHALEQYQAAVDRGDSFEQQLQQTQTSLSNQINGWKSRANELEQELDEASQQRRRYQQSLEGADDESENLRQQLSQASAEIVELNSRLQAAESRGARAEEGISEMRGAIADGQNMAAETLAASRQAKMLASEVDELKRRLARLAHVDESSKEQSAAARNLQNRVNELENESQTWQSRAEDLQKRHFSFLMGCWQGLAEQASKTKL